MLKEAPQMNALYLNRLGLVLGLISGLLLIPEVFNLIPIEKVGSAVNKHLSKAEKWLNIPIKYHPPSWKKSFSEKQREEFVEPITAISAFAFSAIWISTAIFGIISASKFFLFFGLLPPLYATIQKVIIFRQQGYFRRKIIPMVLLAFLSIFVLSPPISFLRIFLLIFRKTVVRGKEFFVNRVALRNLLTILAILMFIASNIFQIMASYLS